MSITEARSTLEDLQAGLPALQELANSTQKVLRAAEATRTPEALEETITARTRAEAARGMLQKHQAEISSVQATISQLEAQAEEARKQKAYADALAALDKSKEDWAAAAERFAANVRKELDKLHEAEVLTSEAYDHAHAAAREAGLTFGNLMGQVVQPHNLSLNFDMKPLAGFYGGYSTTEIKSDVYTLIIRHTDRSSNSTRRHRKEVQK